MIVSYGPELCVDHETRWGVLVPYRNGPCKNGVTHVLCHNLSADTRRRAITNAVKLFCVDVGECLHHCAPELIEDMWKGRRGSVWKKLRKQGFLCVRIRTEVVG